MLLSYHYLYIYIPLWGPNFSNEVAPWPSLHSGWRVIPSSIEIF